MKKILVLLFAANAASPTGHAKDKRNGDSEIKMECEVITADQTNMKTSHELARLTQFQPLF